MSTNTLSDSYRPATFLERGVAVPFTTPVLCSARVRPTSKNRLEFIVSNPSGGPGFYVMGWAGIAQLGQISIHDRMLHEAMAGQAAVSPRTLRDAAQSVALRGAAGRPAAKAAQAMAKKDAEDALIANFLLTMRLFDQGGLRNIDWRVLNPSDPHIKARMKSLIVQLEPIVGASSEELLRWVEEVSTMIAPVGFPSRDYRSRHLAAYETVAQLRDEMFAFGNRDGGDAAFCANFVAEVATLTIETCDAVFKTCWAEVGDVIKLVRGWAQSRERIIEMFTRPDWLLDGWTTIGALWEGTRERSVEEQRAAVIEIERMVPAMPKEVNQWLSAGGPTSDHVGRLWGQRRWVRAHEDWRSGTQALNMTARNEMMRAIAA
jgi:hypothetical protein